MEFKTLKDLSGKEPEDHHISSVLSNRTFSAHSCFVFFSYTDKKLKLIQIRWQLYNWLNLVKMNLTCICYMTIRFSCTKHKISSSRQSNQMFMARIAINYFMLCGSGNFIFQLILMQKKKTSIVNECLAYHILSDKNGTNLKSWLQY